MFLLSRAIKLLWRRDRADDDVEAAEEAHVAVKSGYQHVDGELSEDNEGYATAKSETRDGEAVEIVTVLWHDERGDVEVTAIALSDLEQPNVEESPAAPSANDNLRTAHSGPPSRRSDGRPAAEPPMFNYERFERECIPSDKMLKKAFPGNPAKATAYRDVLTERELLEIYRDWAYDMWSSSYEKVDIDYTDVSKEREKFTNKLADLESWETQLLDKDGNVEKIRKLLEEGEDIFTDHQGGNLAIEKYAFLLDEMPGRPSNDVATWESF